MRTTRRGLTVIELVLILVAIGVVAYFAFRYLGRERTPDAATLDGADTGQTDAPPVPEPAAAPPVTEPGDALAERLGLIAPRDTTAAPGDTVPVRVRATTATGTAVPNATVTFQVITGGGTVLPASLATDDLGEAQTRWILGGAAGAQELRATVVGNEAATLTARVVTAPAGMTAPAGAR